MLKENCSFGGGEKKKRKRKEGIWRKKISFMWRRRKTANEKEEYIWRTKINGDVDDNQPTERANIVQTALSKVRR